MEWPWLCFRIRDISARKVRDAEGRGSCGSYDTKLISLAAQFDCSKTPFTQESGTPTTYAVSSTSLRCADGNGSEKEGNSLTYQEARLRPHVVKKRQGNTDETFLNKSVKGGQYGPRWDNGQGTRESCVSRAPSSSRKSFSELLTETDTIEFSTSRVKGPLAMAAMAAAAERAASPRRLQEEGEGGRKKIWPKHLEANEHTPLGPQSSHLEASQAVADFKENRRRHMSERASNGQANVRNRSLFRSSRKRSLLLRSHLFRRTLSPVPEALSLEEELRSKRQSSGDLPVFFTGDLQQALGGCGDNDSKDLIPSTRIHRRDEERYFLALSEKASMVTSESPLTEERDDHARVEKLHEIPPQTEQENLGGAGASPAPPLCSPGSFMRFGIGLREKIVRDGGLLDDDITTNCNRGCILYEGLDMSACTSGGEFQEENYFFFGEFSVSRSCTH